MVKFNEIISNQLSNSNEDQYVGKINPEIAKQNPTHYFSEKKSQSEEIVFNSSYGPEMFNNLKMELIELEKEKIIAKYKQELMMFIIKS